ncbi:MAG: hypothetical protein WAO95_00365 [Burkholderiales bacterium]
MSSPTAPPSPPPSAGLSVSTSGGSFLGALFALGTIGSAAGWFYHGEPEMDPARRVVEQDCTRPIEDPAANLRCR